MSMIGRRGFIGGLAAMAWRGGDPGTGQGSGIRGGLPGPRPDQQYRPTGPQGPVGSSTGIVKARILIAFGTGETGFFQYNGTPRLGNPPELWAAPPGTSQDPYGNLLPASGGISSGSGASVSQLLNGNLFLYSSGTTGGTPGAVLESPGFDQLVVNSGTAPGHTASTLALTGAAAGSRSARVQTDHVIVGGAAAATSALVELQGVVGLTEQASAPPTPTGAGVFYVDATGHFVYKGPGGTVTVLANP